MTDDAPERALVSLSGIEALAAKGVDFDRPFSAEAFGPIAARYGISRESAPVARVILNVAAAGSEIETEFQRIDKTAARNQLRKVQKQAQNLLRELRQLSPETEIVLKHAFVASQMAPMFERGENGLEGSLAAEGNAPFERDEYFRSFESFSALRSSITAQIEHLDELVQRAENLARGNKPGRPSDETLESLLGAAFLVYENFVGKTFTLEWHSDGEPVSDAACFCVDVVAAFHPPASLLQIATVSRRIRETYKKVSDLGELPGFLDHYHKRSR